MDDDISSRTSGMNDRSDALYHAEYDLHGNMPISTAVVEAVAAAMEVDPIEIPEPLHDCIDVDALENIFKRRPDGTPRIGGSVTFMMSRCEVVVQSDGHIYVYRRKIE